MRRILFPIFVLCLVLFICCGDGGPEAPNTPIPDDPVEPASYELIWADEFDGENGALNTDNWFHQTLLPDGNSWFNGEVQHYTDRLDNSFVEDGFLHIVAKREEFTDQGVQRNFTSARLNSKFAFTYGYVEVRAKLPEGNGTWPAIWTLGRNITENGGYWADEFGTTGWPACGEIDIMEHWGFDQNRIQAALHTPSSFGDTQNKGSVVGEDVSNTFHTYAMEWEFDQIKFFYDSTQYYTYFPSFRNPDTWPYSAPQYLLLNIAMGGIGGDIDTDFSESEMVIDYVRVYQK